MEKTLICFTSIDVQIFISVSHMVNIKEIKIAKIGSVTRYISSFITLNITYKQK